LETPKRNAHAAGVAKFAEILTTATANAQCAKAVSGVVTLLTIFWLDKPVSKRQLSQEARFAQGGRGLQPSLKMAMTLSTPLDSAAGQLGQLPWQLRTDWKGTAPLRLWLGVHRLLVRIMIWAHCAS
jgi:hypothetical protein